MHSFGLLFIFSYVVVNLLILINLVIAMMADTYSQISSIRQGMQNYIIVRHAPAYTVDKVYGSLLTVPPFAFISTLTLPYYFCVKDKKRLKKFNSRMIQLYYSIIFIMLALGFIVVNLLLIPFAYLKTSWHKFQLVRRGRIPAAMLLNYVVFGLLLGLVTQITDFWAFTKTSWTAELSDEKEDVDTMDEAGFTCLHSYMHRLAK